MMWPGHADVRHLRMHLFYWQIDWSCRSIKGQIATQRDHVRPEARSKIRFRHMLMEPEPHWMGCSVGMRFAHDGLIAGGSPAAGYLILLAQNKVTEQKGTPPRRPTGTFGLASKLGVRATRPSRAHKTCPAAELGQGAADYPQLACQPKAAQRGIWWRFHQRVKNAVVAAPFPSREGPGKGWVCSSSPRSTAEQRRQAGGSRRALSELRTARVLCGL